MSFALNFSWSDSTTVLQWQRGFDKKQPIFVANSVAEKLQSSTVDQWGHIAGVVNTDRLGTRGRSLNKVVQSVCINGPDWRKNEINEFED